MQNRSYGGLWGILCILALFSSVAQAAQSKVEQAKITYATVKAIPYRDVRGEKIDEYQKIMCVSDLYYPENKEGFATVVWFHGGGLKNGHRYIPAGLKNKGIAVVGVEYRMMPKVGPEICLDDAAAATAWVIRNIEKYGGDPAKVFVSGHSAGGYLTAMLGLDKSLLGKYGVDTDTLAGYAPYSGQMTKHFNVRKHFGQNGPAPIIDKWAPLFHVRKGLRPFLLLTGDRAFDIPARAEENVFMAKTLKLAGNPDVTMYEMQGHTHMMETAGHPILLRWISAQLKPKEGK